MYWIEIGVGAYVILLIVISVILHDKRGIDFAFTYMCGLGVAGIVWVIGEAIITKGHISFTAVLLTAFAGYMVFKKPN